MFRELVKNGLSDGFGVDPIDKLSMSGPESSPSPHDNDSNSWNSASNSRSPRNAPPWPRVTLPSNSSGTLNRFSRATIFCLKFLCCNDNVYDHRQNVFDAPNTNVILNTTYSTDFRARSFFLEIFEFTVAVDRIRAKRSVVRIVFRPIQFTVFSHITLGGVITFCTVTGQSDVVVVLFGRTEFALFVFVGKFIDTICMWVMATRKSRGTFLSELYSIIYFFGKVYLVL